MSIDAKRFERLLEAVPDALVGMDQQGVIRFVNAQTELLFGYDRDQLIGQHINMLVPDTLWRIYVEHREEYFADPRTRSSGLDLELSGRHHNTGEFPILVSMTAIDSGDVLLVIAGVRDVATQRWAVKNAGLVKALVEYSDDAIVGMSIDGTVMSWTPAAERMYGYSPKEVIGRPDRLIPRERAGELEAVLARIRDGHVEHAETTLVRKNGTVVPVSITAAPIRDEGGTVIGVSAVHRDVTAQRQAFQVAQRLAAIVENSDDAIFGSSLDGIITSWNPGAEGIFGYPYAEIVGRSAELLTPQDRKAEIHDVLARVAAGQHVKNFETMRVRKDGTVFLASVTLSPVRDTDAMIVGASVIAHDVTEQKRAFEATQQMAAIIEGSDDAIFASTLKGTITSWNRAAERLFGYRSQEMIGQSGRVLSPEDRTDEIKTILAKVGAGQSIEHLETIRVRKDGTVVPVSLTVSPIRDEKGGIVGASAISRNMTELRHAGLYARSLIEAAPDPMLTISPEGKINDVNEAAVRVTGIPREQVIATDFTQYFTDPDSARVAYEQTFAQGSLTDYSLTVRHWDGTLTDLSCNASLYRGFNGEVLGVLAAGRDVTEQKKAFEAIQRLASIVENSQDAIFSGLLDGKVTSWNPAAERLYGYSSEEVIGKPAALLAPKERAGEIQATIEKVKAGQHVKEFETTGVRKDGTVFPISLTVSALRDINGAVVGTSVIHSDLTAQKRAEQAVEQDRDLLRATMDSLMDPHVLFEAVRDESGQIVDFVYVDANPAACAYNGVDYQDLVGARLLDLQPGSVGSGLLEQYRRVVETGEPLVLDDSVYAQELMGGRERRYDVRAARVGDGLSYTWRDVTDRHEAAARLAESQEQYRLLAENASDVVFRAGPEGRIGWIAQSVTAVLGWDPEELVGTSIADLFRPDYKIATAQDRVEFYLKGHDVNPEVGYLFELQTKSGDYRWMSGHVRALTDPHGNPAGVVAGLRDVDDLVRARQEAQADRATLHSTLDSLMDPQVLYETVRDEVGRIVDFEFVYANPSACAYFDMDSPDLIGKPLLVLFPGHVEAGLFEHYARVVETGEPLILDDFLDRQALPKAGRRYDIRGARVGDGLSASWRDVTERHEAAEYASRMAAVVEQTHDAIIGTSFPDTLVTSWNPAAERMYGYTAEEVVGKTAFILTPKDQLEQAEALMAQLSAGEAVTDLETVRIRKDGTEVQVSLSSSPIRDANGVTVGLSTIHRDITKEKAAHEYANRMAAVVEYSGDAIIGRGLDDAITSWNPAAERMLGYSRQEILGTSAGVLIPKDRADEVRAIEAKVRAGKTVEHVATTRVRKDGKVIPVSLTVSPIRDVDGAVVGASTIARDLTEQVQKERALAEASWQYRLLAENASDLVVMTSPDRVITWVSPSATHSLGWAVEDLIGKRLLDLVHPDDAAATAGPRDDVYRGQEFSTPSGGFLMRLRTKSGQYRWMAGVATPVKDESGVSTGVVSGLRDVDDLVRAREEAQRLSSALKTSNDSLRDFVAVASHDLRSPLVAIAGFTSILTDNWARLSEEDRLKELGAIQRGVDRLSRLTNDLLTSAKVEAEAEQAQPEHIRLATALASYLEAGREELAAVTVTCPPELVAVVDPAHLTRILDNYLTNAFKYGEPPISIEAQRVGDFVELRVRDRGPGVPPEFVSRLFTKFDRAETPTSRATQGTGLGLSIVKTLAEANHGDASYRQNEPTGGCFVVRLPAGDV